MTNEVVRAVLNTLSICGVTIAVAVPTGGALAVVLSRTQVFGRRWAWMLLCSQVALPLYAFAGAWCAGFGTQGWFTVVMSSLWSPTDTVGSVFSVGIIHALAAIPQVALLCAVGLTWTNRPEEEAAILEGGVGFWVRQTVLPQVSLWLLASCGVCCFPVLTEMVVTNLYQVPSVAELIYLDASLGTVSARTYLVAGGLCVVPLGLLGSVIWWFISKARAHQPVSHFAAQPVDLAGNQLLVSCFAWLGILLLVALPSFSLLTKAGWTPMLGSDGAASYGWTAARFQQTVREAFTLFGQEYYWSALIGVFSSTTAVLLASSLWLIPARLSWIRFFLFSCCFVTICVPGPMVGMIVIWALNRELIGLAFLYDQTVFGVVFAQLFRIVPVAIGFLAFATATIPREVRQQILLDGLSRFGALRCVWPLLWRKLIALWVLLFVLSVGELSASILVLPPGVTTVSMRLFEMLHFGMRHQDSALCGVLVLLGAATGLLLTKTFSARQ